MALISLGDMAQVFTLRRHNASLKVEIDRMTAELGSGKVTDLARKTDGDLGPLTALDASLGRLNAFGSATTEQGLLAEGMQTVLATIDDLTSDFGATLLSAATAGSVTMVNTLGVDARQRFETVVAALNTRLGDRSLFAGQANDQPALPTADVLLATVATVVSGAVTAADVETALDDWFDDPAGYAAQYLGGAENAPIPIAAGESANIPTTALDPAIAKTLKGLAMAALLNEGILPNQAAARAELARRAGESLINSQNDRAYLAAGLGVTQARIESAHIRNQAETTALSIARAGIVSSDPYETAATLEEAQTRLETLYAITARLSRLSLVDFLR